MRSLCFVWWSLSFLLSLQCDVPFISRWSNQIALWLNTKTGSLARYQYHTWATATVMGWSRDLPKFITRKDCGPATLQAHKTSFNLGFKLHKLWYMYCQHLWRFAPNCLPWDYSQYYYFFRSLKSKHLCFIINKGTHYLQAVLFYGFLYSFTPCLHNTVLYLTVILVNTGDK